MTSPGATIRVRPNRYTLALAAILFCMWYVGAAQENGSAYVLVFLAATITALSWLHARANLRSVNIRSGSIKTVEEGSIVCLPLVLTAGTGRVPCGLELTMPGAMEPVFIESLNVDRPVAATLRVAAPERGQHASFSVLVRSYFPLGFFTATRVMTVQQAQRVHPRSAGDMPLPAPSTEKGSLAHTHEAMAASGQVVGEGDDFAGLREWQPGESLRQVDWKAVARGRPLLVKQYEGAPQSTLWLEDTALTHLPVEAAISQLAQWVREAENKGLRYGLRLSDPVRYEEVEMQFPNSKKNIAPGHGPEHERRCLDALAAVTVGLGTGETLAKGSPQRVKTPPTGEVAMQVPEPSMLWLCLALLLAALPFIGTVAWPALATFGVGLVVRWQWQRSGRGAVPQWLRLGLVTLGIAGTYAMEQIFIGIEVGAAVMLCVTAGKLLEARSPRDVQVVALLGWFLCVCAVAIDQGLGRSLYSFAVLLFIAVVLVRIRRGVAGIVIPSKTIAGLLMQALPFVVLLFYIFPRGSGGIVTQLSRRLMHRTGMSSHLNPGSVASIASSTDRVFRATVMAHAGADDQSQYYWRCLVLWQCEGLSWERGDTLGGKRREVRLDQPELRQTILLEPHGDTWMPALDWPVRLNGGSDGMSITYSDMTLRSLQPSLGMRRYEVASYPALAAYELPATWRAAALRPPSSVSPNVRALAKQWQAGGRTPPQIVEAALDYFREQGFHYTVEPGAYSPERGLEEFLLQRRVGFCEHYAASFATLMRLAGVPSRVVVGYLGGDYNAHGNFTLVRQSDAHAWAEVWFDGAGWTRVDPTAALVPARLNSDLRTFMEGGLESAFAQNKNTWWGRSLNEGLLLWDNINYQWYERVVQFDDIAQMELFSELGLLRHRATTLLAVLLVGVGAWGLSVELWLRRRSRHPDAAVRVWLKFCRRLAKAGVPRVPSEGPLEYAERAATALPSAAERIRRIAELYAEMRYGRKALEVADLQGEVKAMVL